MAKSYISVPIVTARRKGVDLVTVHGRRRRGHCKSGAPTQVLLLIKRSGHDIFRVLISVQSEVEETLSPRQK